MRQPLVLLGLLLICGWAGFSPCGLAQSAGPASLAAPPAVGDDADDPTTPQLEAKIDAATDKALEFLASIQHADGSWGVRPARGRASPVSPFCTATGSLAIMAFLAKGYQPGEERYGQTLEKGIDFVLSRQHPNGSFAAAGGQMYAHGITTLMLAEVCGQTTGKQHKQVKDALAKAVKLVLDAQQVRKSATYKGGWRYQPTSIDSDLSCTGWQLMALRAAKNAGADVPTTAVDDAVAYVKRSAAPGGGFGYTPGARTTPALAGTGILCLELCGKHLAKESLAAGEWLLNNPIRPYGTNHQYYTMYYCSQAMFQLGGRYFKQFWPTFAEQVLKRQQPDGSFPLGTAAEGNAGPAYGTSMAVLTLAVRYRLLPIYQR